MGIYLNPGIGRFRIASNSKIFVDKTEMIHEINAVVNTNQRFVCVSRPRRFGKTMAVDMLCAYYDRQANNSGFFEKFKISSITDNDLPWDVYLGKFDVLRITITEFMRPSGKVDDMLVYLTETILDDLHENYPDIRYGSQKDLRSALAKTYAKTNTQFVVVIDEWDSVFREYQLDKEGQKKYLDFLRNLLKDQEYTALAYMTGILPIKKYGKHSALNMFDEYSFIYPMQQAPFTGFTDHEVADLCQKFGRDYDSIKEWYDGYRVTDQVPPDPDYHVLINTGVSPAANKYALYSPLSVVKAILNGIIQNYWNATETYEALQKYIDWNFDGLKEDVAILMNGGRIQVDITGYQNDMTSFETKDDILTMLIHLGYLGYDNETGELFIPNQEVLQVFKTSTRSREWSVTFRALENSQKLLEATWAGNEEKVAELIEAAHDKAGNKTYHSEAALSYAIQLAYYAAQDLYTVIPELDTGKGYADLVYLPKQPDIPAMLVELKYQEDANTAIEQIHRQKYPERLEHYKGNLILVGINYDRTVSNHSQTFKHHSCKIERG